MPRSHTNIAVAVAVVLAASALGCGPLDADASRTIERGVYGQVYCPPDEPECDLAIDVTIYFYGDPSVDPARQTFGHSPTRASDGFYEEPLWPGTYVVCFFPEWVEYCSPELHIDADTPPIRCDLDLASPPTVECGP